MRIKKLIGFIIMAIVICALGYVVYSCASSISNSYGYNQEKPRYDPSRFKEITLFYSDNETIALVELVNITNPEDQTDTISKLYLDGYIYVGSYQTNDSMGYPGDFITYLIFKRND